MRKFLKNFMIDMTFFKYRKKGGLRLLNEIDYKQKICCVLQASCTQSEATYHCFEFTLNRNNNFST